MNKIINTALVVVTAVAALTACEVEDTGGGSAADRNSEASSSYTTAQNNAIDSAKSYLDMGTGFSRSGLIQQLSSKAGEGYKRKDAVFAVNHIKVNYKKQAAKSAKSYMEMGGMSRAGLIQQLTSTAGEGYTLEQAKYAAKQVGY